MKLSKPWWSVGAAVISGVLMALATSLEPSWWAAWIAPIPLLVSAFRSSYRATWLWVAIATLIGLAGRASYDIMFVGPIGETVSALLLVSLTGVVVTLMRALVLRRRYLTAAFFYPAAMAGLGTLVAALSPHGTGGSLAYSQMAFLPAIQIASVAGTAGIIFTFALFAALVSIAWHRGAKAPIPWAAYGVSGFLVAAVLSYGLIQLAQGEGGRTFPVGLAVNDGASPPPRTPVDPNDKSWKEYLAAVPALASAGAKLVVWPEKIAPLDPPAVGRVGKLLGDAARQADVYLLTGVTIIGADHLENRAWLFGPSGNLIADYSKQHLVPGWEARFKPGTEDVVRSLNGSRFGLAICKDMDFPPLGSAYSKLGVDALLVPAYDFDKDAWLHSRMAVLRGVEGGFSVVRSARHGLLTVSDRYGRVVNQKASADETAVSLEMAAPIGPGVPTFYARFGSCFGWVCVAFALLAPLSLAIKGK
jgi:apolipoprotein N-acyltransferase